MTGDRFKVPPLTVLAACRPLAGVPQMELLDAVQYVTSVLEHDIAIARSTVRVLGRHVLNPNAPLDRKTRLRAATALSTIHERSIEVHAVQVICREDTPLDVIQAAAAIVLGTSRRRQLNATTVHALTRHVRRYGQIRGPMVDLLRLSVLTASQPSKDKK